MIEPRQPGSNPRRPRGPVVEGARTEAPGKTGREDERSHLGSAVPGCQDKREPEANGRVEAELVEDTSQLRLDAGYG
jgi:hypothetical protein